MLQMLVTHRLQVPHQELPPQLPTWKGCSPQPHQPHKLHCQGLTGLPLSFGNRQALLKAAVAWAAPKQAWGCKGAFCSLVWAPSPMHPWGTCLVSCCPVNCPNLVLSMLHSPLTKVLAPKCERMPLHVSYANMQTRSAASMRQKCQSSSCS